MENFTKQLFSYAFLLAAALGISFNLQAQDCSDLFISEYIEGSSNNKCIEIYNPTGSAVDLSSYTLAFYFNGSNSPSNPQIQLVGSVAAGDVYVVCDDGSASQFLAQADLTPTRSFFNGDDAVALTKDGANIDVIGVIGNDPGSQWGSGLASTQNNTIRRKVSVTQGNPAGSADIAAEWDGFESNTVDDLGLYMNNCNMPTCVIDDIVMSNLGSCYNRSTPYVGDDTFTASITVSFTFEEPVTTGTLDLTIGGDSYSVNVGHIYGSSHTFQVTLPATGQAVSASASFSAEPACALTKSVGNAVDPCSSFAGCSVLMISEYVEGSSNNKCIELFNPTNGSIDLSDYTVNVYFNGSTTAGRTEDLSGTLGAGETYVICNNRAGSTFLQLSDKTSSNMLFNGNDVVTLEDDNGIVDAVGQLGNSSNFAANVTLHRRPNATRPDNNPFDSFSPTGDYVRLPSNASWGLGTAESDCKPVDNMEDGFFVSPLMCDDGGIEVGSGYLELTSSCGPGLLQFDASTIAMNQYCGDFEIKVKVEDVDNPGFAGIQVRESLSPGSRMVGIKTKASGSYVYREFRSSFGSSKSISPKRRGTRYHWLRLKRTGSRVRIYSSKTGSYWKLELSITMSLPNTVFAGFMTESPNTSTTTTAEFRNIYTNGACGGSSLVQTTTDEQSETAVQSFSATPAIPTAPLAQESVQELRLSPNPASDFLRVDLPQMDGQRGTVVITDLNGRTVYSNIYNGEAQTLEVNLNGLRLTQGMYVLSLRTADKVMTKRFVKTGF